MPELTIDAVSGGQGFCAGWPEPSHEGPKGQVRQLELSQGKSTAAIHHGSARAVRVQLLLLTLPICPYQYHCLLAKY